jgi:hypothetical protein
LVTFGGFHHDIFELLGRGEPRARKHGELAIGAFDAAGGELRVLAADGIFDVLNCKAKPGEFVAVDPHAHGVAPLAINLHVRHTRQILESVDDIAVHIIAEFQGLHAFAAEHEEDDRLCVGLHLGNHGFGDFIRQSLAHP